MFSLPAIIDKSRIGPIAEMKGRVNDCAFVVDGTDYPTRSTVFVGFAGALDLASGKYVGEYRFEPSTGDEDSTFDFASLLESCSQMESYSSDELGTQTEIDTPREQEINEDAV